MDEEQRFFGLGPGAPRQAEAMDLIDPVIPIARGGGGRNVVEELHPAAQGIPGEGRLARSAGAVVDPGQSLTQGIAGRIVFERAVPRLHPALFG